MNQLVWLERVVCKEDMSDIYQGYISASIDEGIDLPPDLLTLHLIATGLLHYYGQVTKGTFLKEDYPLALELGLNRVDALLYRRGSPVFRSIPALLAQCRQPFGKWPLDFPNARLRPEEQLLGEAFPTQLCHDLACASPDVEADLSERRFMERVFALCRNAPPAFYAEFRRFLIMHPVLTAAEFLQHQEALACAEVLKEPLRAAYEPAPPDYVSQAHFLCCPHCGNLLQPKLPEEHFVCEDERCRRIPYASSHAKKQRRIPARQEVYWLRRDLRRFVMMPGRAELRLEETLLKLGVQVVMWPAFDRYDLRVILPGAKQTTIAVDVKDWASPLLLALKVKREAFPITPGWDAAYFVFPQERRRDQPRYVDIFRSTCNAKPSHLTIGRSVKAAFEDHFVGIVKSMLKKEKAYAH